MRLDIAVTRYPTVESDRRLVAGSRPRHVEFLVLLTGFDETFSQTVHTRSSYKGEEVIWGASFASLFNPVSPDGVLSVDIGRLHAIEKRLPAAPAAAALAAEPREPAS